MNSLDLNKYAQELRLVSVTYGDFPEKTQQALAFVLSNEDYTREHEAMLVCLVRDECTPYVKFEAPVKLVFDGGAYPCAVSEQEVKEAIGESVFNRAKKKMDAIETLVSCEIDKDIDNFIIEARQK